MKFFKVGTCILQYCLNHGDIIKSPLFQCHLELWEKNNFYLLIITMQTHEHSFLTCIIIVRVCVYDLFL